MKTIHQWLSEYGESHQNKTNKTIHWICVPLIMFSLVGLLWSIPKPEIFNKAEFPFNFGVVFMVLALFYYMLCKYINLVSGIYFILNVKNN